VTSPISSTPATAARYVIGINGDWHAIDTAAAARALRPGVLVPAALAVCGDLAQVVVNTERTTGTGTIWLPYDRATRPVNLDPCYGCAWAVAVATGQADREAGFLTPSPKDAAALARFLPDHRRGIRIRRLRARSPRNRPAAHGGDCARPCPTVPRGMHRRRVRALPTRIRARRWALQVPTS
jgi:hypothetical protein